MTRCLGILAVAVAVLAVPAEAQFGRNKVQYRAFDFEVIKTEHFDVYFYPQERQASMDAARMAERAYARLSRLLQHEFRERKPLILYASHSDFQQTNALAGFIGEGTGGVTEILKNRVILPFTGSYADFEHVLTHELVHAFQFDVLFRHGVIAETSPSLGRIPLWFMEGMAEYLSIGRIDPHTASCVRDAALGGYIRSIAEMNRRDDYLSYRFGQSLWAFIGEKWGDEVVGILLQKVPRMGLERAFASTLGLTLDELSNEWLTAVRSTHLPELVQREGPDRFGTRLTEHDALYDPWYLAPALSPDGELVVYASQRDGFFVDLWLADARTGEVLDRLVKSSRSADFESLRYQSSAAAFSPDGRYVALAAQSRGRDALYIYDLERRRIRRRLTFPINGINNPSWAPDGHRIVFAGLDGGLSDLFVTDLDGNLERLTRDRYADLTPSWSPDGRRIAFTTDRGPATDMARLRYGNFRVALLEVATGRIELLPGQEEGKNLNPVWAPDGRSLAWVSDRTGVNDLYLFDLEQRELARVTNVLSGIIGTNHLTPVLSWARHAPRLVFVYFEDGGYNLYAVEDPRLLPRTPVRMAPAPAVASASESAEPASHGTGPSLPGTNGATHPAAEPSPERPWEAADGFPESIYRASEAFRLSARPPGGTDEEGDGPLSVVALLDSADMALPDTSDFDVVDYDVSFSPDIVGRPTIGASVGGYYGNGLYGGSYISLSDMLGNHNVVLAGNINGSLSDAVFYGGYAFLKRRVNWGASFQQVPFYRYRGLQSFELDHDGTSEEALAHIFLRDVIRSARGVASYPFSQFRRAEIGMSAVYFKRDYLLRGVFRESGRPVRRDDRIGDVVFYEPSAALVFDNVIFGWTGPVMGRRYRIQLSRTLGDYAYDELFLDLRNYWNLDQALVLAGRFVALVRNGPDADRFSLYWGGPYFIRGYDATSFDYDGPECAGSGVAACPARDQLIGSSAAFMNLEVRFPVITELQLGFLGAFPPVDAVAFFDGGLAWDNQVCTTLSVDPTAGCPGARPVHVVWERGEGQDPYLYRAPLFSYGLGLRLNVFYAILRLDYAFPLTRPDRSGVFSVSFGPSF